MLLQEDVFYQDVSQGFSGCRTVSILSLVSILS